MLMSLVILCIMCIWHSIVTKLMDRGEEFVMQVENNVFIAFAVGIHTTSFIVWLVVPQGWELFLRRPTYLLRANLPHRVEFDVDR